MDYEYYINPKRKRNISFISQELFYKDIARKLNISEKTVRNHISNVIQKLGVKSRIQAVFELIRLKELQL